MKIRLLRDTKNGNVAVKITEHGYTFLSVTWMRDANGVTFPRGNRVNPQKAKRIACLIRAMVELGSETHDTEDAVNNVPGELECEVTDLALKYYKEWKDRPLKGRE